jgi:hypothetical protein
LNLVDTVHNGMKAIHLERIIVAVPTMEQKTALFELGL